MKYELHSPLSLEESIRRVEERLLDRILGGGSAPFWGQVQERRVSLRLARGMRNPFAPYFRGYFEPTASGTLLRGECRVLTGPKIAAIVWGVFWLCAPCALTITVEVAWISFLLALGESLQALGAETYRTFLTLPLSLLAFPLAGIVVGVGAPALFIGLRRGDCERIVALLEEALELEEIRVIS